MYVEVSISEAHIYVLKMISMVFIMGGGGRQVVTYQFKELLKERQYNMDT
jgi:hypothetical protein